MPELFTGESVAAAMSAPAPTTETAASDATSTGAGASPATETAATAPPVPEASTPAVDATATTPAQPKVAEPPAEKWPQILANARTKASEETEAKYGWAKDVPEQHRPTVGQFYGLLERDPAKAVEVLVHTTANDPQHAPALRSLFGRLLGNRAVVAPASQPPPQAQGFPDADAEGVDDTGHRIPLYSATRMKDVVAHIKREISADFSKTLEPIQSDFQTRQQRDQQIAMQRDADTHAQKVYTRVSAYPAFREHERAIAAAMTADPTLDVTEAYVQIVVPKLQQVERSNVAARLHAKTEAASLNPAGGTLPAKARPRSFQEAIERGGGIRF